MLFLRALFGLVVCFIHTSGVTQTLNSYFKGLNQEIISWDRKWSPDYPLFADHIRTKSCLNSKEDSVSKLKAFMEGGARAQGIGESNLYFLTGLCYLNAGLDAQALTFFGLSADITRNVVESLDREIKSNLAVHEANLRGQEFTRKALEEQSKDFELLGAIFNIGFQLTGARSTQTVSQLSSLQASNSRELQNTKLLLNDIQLKVKASSSSLKSVIGLDQTIRVPIIPVGGFLRYIVKINSSDSSGAGSCTGAFVGPNLVLTNFHCLKDRMTVVRDSFGIRQSFNVIARHTAYGPEALPKGKALSDYFIDDWAILEVEGVRSDADSYLWVSPRTPDKNLSTMIAGYSGDVSGGIYLTADIGCPGSLSAGRRSFVYKCSTYKGSSGSPVLSTSDQRFIIALNNAVDLTERDTAKTRGIAYAVPTERFSGRLYQLLGSQPRTAFSDEYSKEILSEFGASFIANQVSDRKKGGILDWR